MQAPWAVRALGSLPGGWEPHEAGEQSTQGDIRSGSCGDSLARVPGD